MTSIKNIIVAAAFSTLSIATAHADQTMKPLQAVSFHAGTKHAVGYFLTESKTCKLVLTIADDAKFVPARFETAIDAGKSTDYQLAEGKSLEFACRNDAQAMVARSSENLAAN